VYEFVTKYLHNCLSESVQKWAPMIIFGYLSFDKIIIITLKIIDD
jgi:hypothetical protein